MVVTKSCERCGDSLVLETKMVGADKLVQIEMYPAKLADRETGEDFDVVEGDQIAMLYGLVAVPDDVTRPSWVVSQYTILGALVGHKLHRLHVCAEHSPLPSLMNAAVAARGEAQLAAVGLSERVR